MNNANLTLTAFVQASFVILEYFLALEKKLESTNRNIPRVGGLLTYMFSVRSTEKKTSWIYMKISIQPGLKMFLIIRVKVWKTTKIDADRKHTRGCGGETPPPMISLSKIFKIEWNVNH